MVRGFYLIHKQAGMDFQAFRDYWQEVHGPLVAALPGIRKYVQSHCFPDPHGDALPADGIEDLEFDSVDAMQTALGSPAGQAMLADLANFVDQSTSGPVIVGEDVR